MPSFSNSPLAVAGVASLIGASMFATSDVDVAPGDTLSEIADEHGVTVAQLRLWNGLSDPDFIRAGDSLSVDGSAAGGGRYVVALGETLSEIAEGLDTPLPELAAANGITDPDVIIEGQVLTLDGASAPAPTSTATTTTTVPPDEDSAPSHDEPATTTAAPTTAPPTTAAPTTAPPTTAPPTTAPPADEPAGDEPAGDEGAAADGADRYTVEAGDTLSQIAERLGVSTAALAEANDIGAGDVIRIGDVLTVPDTDESPAAPTTTTAPEATTTTAAPTTTTTTTTTTTEPPAPTTAAPSTEALSPLFSRWAATYGVRQSLLEAVAWHQSGWDAGKVGGNGALGITQLSPELATFVETQLVGQDLEPLAASDGIQLGARYLRYLMDRTTSEREALAAWSQGLDDVRANGVSDSGGEFADAVLAIDARRS